MANILPVHQMLNPLPNFNATWQQGVQFGQQQKQRSEAREREQQVRNLAPQIVAGDPAAYAQAAAVDPQAAGQFQQAGDAQLRRFKGFVSYIDQAREQAKQTGQWQHVDAALQQAGPYLTQLLGKPGPTAWPQGDPQWEAGWEALKARIAGADSAPTAAGVQSTYVDADGNRVAILRDGSTRILGQNDAGMSQQTLNVDINGVPTQITFDKRTGRYTTAALGAQAPAQPVGAPAGTVIAESGQAMPVTQFTGSDGRPVNIGDDIPPHLRQQILGQSQQFAVAPDGAMATLPTVNVPPAQFGAGAPLVGRTKEAEAAAVEAAKQGVQLQYAPQQQAIETQGHIDRQLAESQIKPTKAQEAVDSQYGKDYVEFISGGAADANKALSELNDVIEKLEGGANLTGPFLGALPMGVKARTHPEAAATQETVESTVQRSLRVILGAQFTEKEGERLIARAYNPSLPESENLIRVRRLFRQLQEGFENKAAAARYYEQNGTLRGFRGKLPSWGDFDPDNDVSASGGGQYAPAPADGPAAGNQFQNTAPVVDRPAAGGAVRVQSAADYEQLPPGALYIAPDGTQRRKR